MITSEFKQEQYVSKGIHRDEKRSRVEPQIKEKGMSFTKKAKPSLPARDPGRLRTTLVSSR